MLSEIKGAFSGGTSEYKINRIIEPRSFDFLPTDKPIHEMGLLSIFNDGRVSNMVTEYKANLTCMKSKAGEASWIKRHARERVRFDDDDCFVKGFKRQTFHVCFLMICKNPALYMQNLH